MNNMKISLLFPSFISNTGSAFSSMIFDTGNATNWRTVTPQDKIIFTNVQRIVLAAGICFASCQISTIAAVLVGGALSSPAAMLASGVLLIKYGCIALKAGLAARQLAQVELGALALFTGWQALDKADSIKKGVLEGDCSKIPSLEVNTEWFISKIIGTRIGLPRFPSQQ